MSAWGRPERGTLEPVRRRELNGGWDSRPDRLRGVRPRRQSLPQSPSAAPARTRCTELEPSSANKPLVEVLGRDRGLGAAGARRSAHRKKRAALAAAGHLFQDGSRHEWLAGEPELDLIATMDDATGEIYSAFRVAEEGTASSLRSLVVVPRPVLVGSTPTAAALPPCRRRSSPITS